jgi:hypothetical protein
MFLSNSPLSKQMKCSYTYYRRNQRQPIYRSSTYSLLQRKQEYLTLYSGIDTRRSIFVEMYETVISWKTLHRGSNYTKLIIRVFEILTTTKCELSSYYYRCIYKGFIFIFSHKEWSAQQRETKCRSLVQQVKCTYL